MKLGLAETLNTVAIGLGATLVMDLWGVFLKRAFGIPFPNYCFVGRWLRYMPEGTFQHRSISAAPKKSAECIVGWIAHYAIGVLFALSLVLLASPRWLEEPMFVPAMAWGLATVVLPLFVMQPSFGLGLAASKTPNPAQTRLRSLMNHAVFGFGLYVSALVIKVALET